MNISANTIIINEEKDNCSRGHLQQCFHDKNLHGSFFYSYFGTRVLKGTVDLYTKNGVFCVKFDAEYSWLRTIEML